MAFSRTKQLATGFEYAYTTSGSSSDPRVRKYRVGAGVTVTRGDAVVLTNGVIQLAASGDTANILGVAAETVTASAGTSSTVTWCDVVIDPCAVFRYSIPTADLEDVAVTAVTNAGQFTATSLTENTVDAYNGSILVVYSGPGKGSVRTVSNYIAGGTYEVFLNQYLTETPTTSTNFIIPKVRAGAGDGGGVMVGALRVLTDQDSINMQDEQTGPVRIVDVDADATGIDLFVTFDFAFGSNSA